MKEKIIFLDIDGVLNTDHSRHTHNQRDHRDFATLFDQREWCANACANLSELIKRTGAKVIISSTWRIDERFNDFCELFSKNNIPVDSLLGVTPLDNTQFDKWHENRSRGNEIDAWFKLERGFEVESFVVIDDVDIWFHEHHKNNLVLVDQMYGFANKNALKQALKILGEKE